MIQEKAGTSPLSQRLLFDLFAGPDPGATQLLLPANAYRHSLLILSTGIMGIWVNGTRYTMAQLAGAGINKLVMTYEEWGPVMQNNIGIDNASAIVSIKVFETYYTPSAS